MTHTDKQPQTVSRWVKVSERLPLKTYNYFVRATRKHQGYCHNDTALFRLETKNWVFIDQTNDLIVVEWLEEVENVYLFTPAELEALKAEWQIDVKEKEFKKGFGYGFWIVFIAATASIIIHCLSEH